MTTTKIGKLVQLNVPQLLAFCAVHDSAELVRLSDKEYSRERFKLSYPFLVTPAEADLITQQSGKSHYYAQVHDVLDHRVRVTNEWFARSRSFFIAYLADLGLEPIGVSAEELELALDEVAALPLAKASSVGGARYRKTAIGDSQNAVVRHVLGTLGHESFTEKDWLAVKRTFGHCCAYCGERRMLVMDHAVPISIASLGEHRLGNLVPACHPCNTAKKDLSYDDYLRTLTHTSPDVADRIAAIDAHLARHGYTPLDRTLDASAARDVREALRELRQAVDRFAGDTRRLINDFLVQRDRVRG